MKKFLAFFLTLIFVLPIFSVAASQETRERLREAERLNSAAGQRVSEQRNLLEGTEFEMSQIMAEMQELDQQIMDASERLETIEMNLLATEIRIAETEEELAIAQAESNMQRELLRERLRSMYEQGSVGMLEVLFQAESMADFLIRWEYIRMVAQFDQDLLARLEASEERVASNIDDLTRSRALVLELQSQEEEAKSEIERAMDEKTAYLILLAQDAERQAEFLSILEEEAHTVRLEYGIVQRQYQFEVDEAERIRREEQARLQAEEDARRAAEAAVRQAEQNERLATLNSFDSFAWPVPSHSEITSGFGNRLDPFTNRTAFHSGIDIPAPSGTRINAAEAGFVRFAGWSAGYGNYIIIDHADGFSTLYGHNSRNRVSTGDRVTRGQHIADVGTTGRSTGNHLHFEVLLDGSHIDPMQFFGG